MELSSNAANVSTDIPVAEPIGDAAPSTTVEVTRGDKRTDPIESVIEESVACDLIFLGADHPDQAIRLSFGKDQDEIIDKAAADVFVVIGGNKLIHRIRRILVPVNGTAHALAAADVAAYIAKANDAEVVFLAVVHSELPENKQQLGVHRIRKAGRKLLKEVAFRTKRLDIDVREEIVISEDRDAAIAAELNKRPYDLVVLGAVDRSGDAGIFLGKSIQSLLAKSKVPTGILVMHQKQSAA